MEAKPWDMINYEFSCIDFKCPNSDMSPEGMGVGFYLRATEPAPEPPICKDCGKKMELIKTQLYSNRIPNYE